MLMRTDPFRDFDRLTQQLFGAGTPSRPAVMPMDAWREGDTFVLEFDLPGVAPDTIDLDVERNVLTIKAERPSRGGDWEMLAAERPPACSAGSSSWATTSTPTASTPTTTAACCGCGSRWPRRPSPARSRSPRMGRRPRRSPHTTPRPPTPVPELQDRTPAPAAAMPAGRCVPTEVVTTRW